MAEQGQGHGIAALVDRELCELVQRCRCLLWEPLDLGDFDDDVDCGPNCLKKEVFNKHSHSTNREKNIDRMYVFEMTEVMSVIIKRWNVKEALLRLLYTARD